MGVVIHLSSVIVHLTSKKNATTVKVLMLGWEFPPLFSGGLGIATLGIVQALREKATIKLIVPSHTGSMSMPNVSIIGLNRTPEHRTLFHPVNGQHLPPHQ